MNEHIDMKISGSSSMPGGEYRRVSISGAGKVQGSLKCEELHCSGAASITPAGTSFKEDSTMRATYGAAAMINVTMTAPLPVEVPSSSFAAGIMATMRMTAGMERKKFTMKPSTTPLLGCSPSLSVAQRMTPSGRPMRYAKIVVSAVM